MRPIISFLLLICCLQGDSVFAASASRSDTIDIRKTIIDFTITDFATKIISAKTTLDIKSKLNNVTELIVDLEGLTVDSVFVNNVPYGFSFTSTTIHIPLAPLILNLNDTALVDIYYHGVPIADATWGGFSFNGNYGYQLGVGMSAQPHSFGRTWHPCFDNFVERSSYEFFITTEDTKVGICNGLLIDSTTNAANNTKHWHWKLDEEIPAYLACLAVSNYVFVNKILNGNNGPMNAMITCLPADTNKVNGSFAHLQESFSMLEQHFGTYSWPRVGYSLVPFNGGAMEHATNISIGTPFINGALTYETLIAHELSHHWFGDLVTCSTAGDMWLNEGMASYCEALHLEHVYGTSSYINEIKTNHFDVLNKAHIDDDGYKAVANMDSLHTYGPTVYNKGKDVTHTLRSYMGDTLFFNTIRDFVNTHKFQSINSLQFRDYLSMQSGIDLTDYFNNWIFAPGFPHFSIDSSNIVPNGSDFNVSVFMRQRKHHSTDYYNHVPLELAFYNDQMVPFIYKLEFNGRCMQFNVTLPFNPTMIVVDPYSKISDAITEEQKMVYGPVNIIFNQAKCKVMVKSVILAGDSTLVRAEHHWIAPDRFRNPLSFPGYVLCDTRYWKIDGIHLQNVKGLLQFAYEVGLSNSYLDSNWVKNTEDSIRLFYRKDSRDEWQFADDSLVAGSLTDGHGVIYAKEIKAGEYTFGIKRSSYTDPLVTDAPTGGCGLVNELTEWSTASNHWYACYPNPASNDVYFKFSSPIKNEVQVRIVDALGDIVLSQMIYPNVQQQSIKIDQLTSGFYVVHLLDSKSGRMSTEKLVIER